MSTFFGKVLSMFNVLELLKVIRPARPWLRRKPGNSSPAAAVTAWATEQKMSYTGPHAKSHYLLGGDVGGQPWTLERRASSRVFIKGDELNARAALNVHANPVVIVMNRALKTSLEKQAFEIYTDSVQTRVQPRLIEEMRWIALYPECVRLNFPPDFQRGFSVLASHSTDAEKWISHELAQLILTCQAERFDTPFILMLLRGKVYLQMELDKTGDEIPKIERSVAILRTASVSALLHFPKPML